MKTQFGNAPTKFSREYLGAFGAFMRSGGAHVSAALYEGGGAAGGFAVPSYVLGDIVPLVPSDSAVLKLATVTPTSTDLFIPVETAVGTAVLKPESGASPNLFTGSSPTLGAKVKLSAFMAGGVNDISIELYEDVPLLGSWLTNEMLDAQQTVEEALYISGTGVNEAQGLIGNVGLGVSGVEPDNFGPIPISSLFDLIGTLKDKYVQGASFLMSRATATTLRKSALAQNIAETLFTRVGPQEYLLGFPVEFSAAMPAAARGNCPILFGDFKAGYIIGFRGGPELRVKVLDQANVLSGLISALTFRRTDGRVRRPEAIQGLSIAAS